MRVSGGCARSTWPPPRLTDSNHCSFSTFRERRVFDMCGIAGAIGQLNPKVRTAVATMSSALVHRGPDDLGQWCSADSTGQDRGAMLAFRRLAIIDLSPAAHQPMIDPATGNVIIFNGEIYNYEDVRRT